MADATARRARTIARGRGGRAGAVARRLPNLRVEAVAVPSGPGSRRMVRSVDTRSVVRVSFLFYLCVLLVFLVAGILLWTVAAAFGVIHNVEKFIQKLFDLNSFHFQAWSILLGTGLGGMVFVVLGTGANVLAALLYNLISDITGGVAIETTEEETQP
jgi:hypothetical protein